MNPNGANGEIRNYGMYDPFPYRHWLYPEVARNGFENPDSSPFGVTELQPALNPEMERILGPRELCFLPSPGKDGFAIPRQVGNHERGTEYVFIGYTAEQFNHDSEEDMAALDITAARAAREAEVPAYWIASSCMSDEAELVNDVYHIGDVIRGAHSLAIAIGSSRTRPGMSSTEEMLKMLGERMWTLPEALLSSNKTDIKVYTRGEDEQPAMQIPKNRFAALVWDDPLVSRQLVDHYNGNLVLSRLELVTIALRCLSQRSTHEKLLGDMSYALIGLMRRRPVVEPTDSKFKSLCKIVLSK